MSLRVPLQNKLTFLARTASVCALGICVLCKQDVILSNHKSSCNSSQQHERKPCGCVCVCVRACGGKKDLIEDKRCPYRAVRAG